MRPRDDDALWEKLWKKMKDSAPEALMAWHDCGLLDEKGAPRPAYEVWKKYFEMPLESP